MNEVTNTWHLAQTPKELELTEFELMLWQVFHAFLRWQEDCELSANNNSLSGQELAILHLVHMKEREKGIGDVARLLHREDMPNLKYSFRKLLGMGLIQKARGEKKKGATYKLTEAGIKNIENYVKARRRLLIAIFEKETSINLPETHKALTKIKAIYNEASRHAASYKDITS